MVGMLIGIFCILLMYLWFLVLQEIQKDKIVLLQFIYIDIDMSRKSLVSPLWLLLEGVWWKSLHFNSLLMTLTACRRTKWVAEISLEMTCYRC
jgi:hypothetical protein